VNTAIYTTLRREHIRIDPVCVDRESDYKLCSSCAAPVDIHQANTTLRPVDDQHLLAWERGVRQTGRSSVDGAINIVGRDSMITRMNSVCIALILIGVTVGRSVAVHNRLGLAPVSRRISTRFHWHLASGMQSRSR